ncbi:hypothetical protein KM043_001570 [Ampulex compressa]|nr:hypothetical protein KM043_001570 [Ampulex compressa]
MLLIGPPTASVSHTGVKVARHPCRRIRRPRDLLRSSRNPEFGRGENLRRLLGDADAGVYRLFLLPRLAAVVRSEYRVARFARSLIARLEPANALSSQFQWLDPTYDQAVEQRAALRSAREANHRPSRPDSWLCDFAIAKDRSIVPSATPSLLEGRRN